MVQSLLVLLLLLSCQAMGRDFSSEGREAVYALGISPGIILRHDYASRSFHQLYPEAAGYRYDNLAGSFWLRTGVRMGYAWTQPDMTLSLQVQERDLFFGGDFGLLYDWYVMPVFGAGAQEVVRSLSLKVSKPIAVATDRISGTETFLLGYCHIGLGIPLVTDRFMLEPWWRWLYAPDDWRLEFSYGAELSLRIF